MSIGFERDYFFDNLKFFLIVLVVVGHAIEPLIDQNVALKSIYLFIYSFHMPLFVFVAGYFSKRFITSRKKEKLTSLLTLYVIAQALSSLFYIFVTGTQSISWRLILFPNWTLWFLLSMFFWYLLLPYVIKLRYSILIAITIAILIGYINRLETVISISRTFVYLPFFLTGYYFKKEEFTRLKSTSYREVAVVVIFCAILGFYFFHDIDHRWLYGSYSYARLGHFKWYSGIYRLGILMVQALVSLSVLMLIPKSYNLFTNFGRNTLYPYLLHTYVFSLMQFFGVYKLINSSATYIFLILFAVILAIMLSTNAVRDIFKVFFEPNKIKKSQRAGIAEM